jgi:hypothetical protein
VTRAAPLSPSIVAILVSRRPSGLFPIVVVVVVAITVAG